MKISTGLGALVIGLALASTGAVAQSPGNSAGGVIGQEAPLSPGGISAPASAFGGPGPGYIGPRTQVVTPRAERGPLYNVVPQAAPAVPAAPYGPPLSPGGISTGGSTFGGPGYNPPGGLGGR